jgi:hypothetical protein
MINVEPTHPYPRGPEQGVAGRQIYCGVKPLTLAEIVNAVEREGISYHDVTFKGGSLRWERLESGSERDERVLHEVMWQAKQDESARRQYETLKRRFEPWLELE